MSNGINIDTLKFAINISGITEKKVQTLNNLSKALKSIDKSLNPDFTKKLKALGNLQLNISGIGKMFKPFSQEKANSINAISRSFKSLSNVLNADFIKRLQKVGQINFMLRNFDKFKNYLQNQQSLNSTSNISALSEDDTDSTNPSSKKLIRNGETEKQKRRRKKERQEKESNVFTKLTGKFKSIAIYRGIRSLLELVSQLLKTGLENIARFSVGVNKTMSTIITYVVQMANVVGQLLIPFIQIIEPFLKFTQNAVINIANTFSQIVAFNKGENKYMKINAQYTKDFANSLSKASGFAFDTFNVLSEGSGAMFDWDTVQEQSTGLTNLYILFKDIMEAVGSLGIQIISSLGPALTMILEIVGNLWMYLKPLWDVLENSLLEVLVMISDILVSILKFLNPIIGLLVEIFSPSIEYLSILLQGLLKILNPIIVVMVNIINALESLITLDFKGFFDNLMKGFLNLSSAIVILALSFIKSIVGFVNTIANTIKPIIEYIINVIGQVVGGIGDILSFLGLDTSNWGFSVDFDVDWNIPTDWIDDLISQISGNKLNIGAFANGGLVDNGTLFLAGEAGAEIVYNTGHGQTGIMNVEQMGEALKWAIIESGVIESIEESGNLYLDNEKVGKKVGQSKGLRNELNRTNPSLRLK